MILILISAKIEWQAIRGLFPHAQMHNSPYGEWFEIKVQGEEMDRSREVIYFHGGWGKIAAAGSTQYVIDRWHPELLVNLGTCGGLEGQVSRGTVLLVERTLVYDIVEQMGDYDEHIAHYATLMDLSWLSQNDPAGVRRALLVSGDRDILAEDVEMLKARFGAIAADWESGAIAYVAQKNGVRCLILRGVTDLVNSSGGEAYGDIGFFTDATHIMMNRLVTMLPSWLSNLDNELAAR